MSAADEQLILDFYEAFNARGPAAIPDYFAEDAVWHDDPDLPDGGTVQGIEALTDRIRAYTEIMGHFQILEPRIIDLAGGSYLAEFTLAVRGEASGIAMEQAHAHHLRVVDGKVAEATQVIGVAAKRRELGLEG